MKSFNQQIVYLGNRSPSIVAISNFYTSEELELIWRELDFLTHKDKLLGPEKTYSAKSDGGIPMKNNSSLFLEQVYNMRTISDILRINKKIFHKPFIDLLVKKDPLFAYLSSSNCNNTLINYYEDTDYYKEHSDAASLTALTFFFREPKRFSGGDLLIKQFDIKVEIENNLLIIMPSSYLHEVTPVKMDGKECNGFGRYSMTQFITHV
jgi:Rps23 Pro-64 3,4-dihydroxylase Tpa1-like proline 4-hydroxylase